MSIATDIGSYFGFGGSDAGAASFDSGGGVDIEPTTLTSITPDFDNGGFKGNGPLLSYANPAQPSATHDSSIINHDFKLGDFNILGQGSQRLPSTEIGGRPTLGPLDVVQDAGALALGYGPAVWNAGVDAVAGFAGMGVGLFNHSLSDASDTIGQIQRDYHLNSAVSFSPYTADNVHRGIDWLHTTSLDLFGDGFTTAAGAGLRAGAEIGLIGGFGAMRSAVGDAVSYGKSFIPRKVEGELMPLEPNLLRQQPAWAFEGAEDGVFRDSTGWDRYWGGFARDAATDSVAYVKKQSADVSNGTAAAAYLAGGTLGALGAYGGISGLYADAITPAFDSLMALKTVGMAGLGAGGARLLVPYIKEKFSAVPDVTVDWSGGEDWRAGHDLSLNGRVLAEGILPHKNTFTPVSFAQNMANEAAIAVVGTGLAMQFDPTLDTFLRSNFNAGNWDQNLVWGASAAGISFLVSPLNSAMSNKIGAWLTSRYENLGPRAEEFAERTRFNDELTRSYAARGDIQPDLQPNPVHGGHMWQALGGRIGTNILNRGFLSKMWNDGFASSAASDSALSGVLRSGANAGGSWANIRIDQKATVGMVERGILGHEWLDFAMTPEELQGPRSGWHVFKDTMVPNMAYKAFQAAVAGTATKGLIGSGLFSPENAAAYSNYAAVGAIGAGLLATTPWLLGATDNTMARAKQLYIEGEVKAAADYEQQVRYDAFADKARWNLGAFGYQQWESELRNAVKADEVPFWRRPIE